jgi:LysM repeat protein
MLGLGEEEIKMKLLRIGVIAGAHMIVIAILYLMSGFGNSVLTDSRVSVAGANGIVNWSSEDPNALAPTVSGAGFVSKVSELTGFNAGDGSSVNRAMLPEISSKQRFEPRRPGGSEKASPPASTPSRGNFDSGVLAPLGRSPAEGSRAGQRQNIIAPSSTSQFVRYTVRSGDSIWGITQKFGVSQSQLQSMNPGLTVNIQPGQVLNVPRSGQAPEPISGSAQPASVVDGSIYVVKSGDALSRIAANQGVTLSALRAANNLSGDLIRVGQKLVIPNGRKSSIASSPLRKQGLQIVVAPGDTLSTIAIRYNVSAKDLILHNDIQNPARINPGQTLFIPSSLSTTPRSSPPPVVVEKRDPVPTLSTIPEDAPLILPDEDDFLEDEGWIEQPVIQIEN